MSQQNVTILRWRQLDELLTRINLIWFDLFFPLFLETLAPIKTQGRYIEGKNFCHEKSFLLQKELLKTTLLLGEGIKYH